MVGVVLTGHGKFAEGLNSAVELIAGKQESWELVNFEEGQGLEELTTNLTKAIETLKECESIFVLSDLAGGSPFKTAVEVGLPYGNVQVIAGTNLPMLAELALMRKFSDDSNALLEQILNTGATQVVKFEIKKSTSQNTFDEDGI